MTYSKCTIYKNIQFEEGLLDKIIDAVYVILLKNSKRKNSKRTKNVYDQIYKYKLSKNIIIQENKHFKECDIKLCEQKPYSHLLHNTINIFKHANKKKYKNILVLEDDFIFDDNIKSKDIINDLDFFINNNKFNLYYLGVEPNIINPFNINLKHLKLLVGFTTHSIIYSKEGRNILIKKYEKNYCINNLKFHDLWYNLAIDKKFFYYKPLCYQPKENTKNKKEWENVINNFIINIFKLDKSPITGYKNLYIFVYIIHIILLIFIILIIVLLVK